MLENALSVEGNDESAKLVDQDDVDIAENPALSKWWNDTGIDKKTGLWEEDVRRDTGIEKKIKKQSDDSAEVTNDDTKVLKSASNVREIVRDFIFKYSVGKPEEMSVEAQEAEHEFWNNAGDIIDRFFDSYTEQARHPKFSQYLLWIRDEEIHGKSTMSPLSKTEHEEFMALRGIVRTLQYLFKKYKKKRRKVSKKLAMQHPVRVMEIMDQVRSAFSAYDVSTAGLHKSEMELFVENRKNILRKSVAAMLHDVVEDFYDGEYTPKVEKKIRKLLEDVFLPIPEATEEDVEMVLQIVRLTTKPQTRYATGKEGRVFDEENGFPKYMEEYERYLKKIDLAVKSEKEEGKYAMEIKLMDVLHNGSTANPEEWDMDYLFKKQQKAELAGKYVLSHFPNLRKAAQNSLVLTALIVRIEKQDRFLFAEIMKLPAPDSA